MNPQGTMTDQFIMCHCFWCNF